MPVAVRSHPHQTIDASLWNLLPDNEGVLRRWGREFQVSATSAFSLLTTPVGEDCAGAVRFARPDDIDRVLRRGGEVTWLTTAQVAGRLLIFARTRPRGSAGRSPAGPSPAQIAEMLRRASPPGVGEETVRRFADALIWNWLVGGTDAHAKNYSLLLAGDQVRLAPLYDVASALPYGTHERKLRMAMKLVSGYALFPDRNPWPGTARDLSLDPAALVGRVRELAHAVPEACLAAATALDVASLNRRPPARLAELISRRAQRCLRVL